MKVSPISSAANTVGSEGQGVKTEGIRALKMRTNATPLNTPPVIEEPKEEKKPEELIISDNNETKVGEEATQPLSPQYAELARKRRALQVKERELADKEKAFLERSNTPSIEIARLKSEPLRVLQEAGVTYDQLTEALLANQSNPEVIALKQEINALKEGIDKKFSDNETQAEQQVLAAMRKEATELVKEGEEYALVRETQSVPSVIKLIERTYRETGEVLEVSEALKLVEEELFKEVEKTVTLKKVQEKFIPQTPPAPEPKQLANPGIRTLTNKHTASTPVSRKERALAAFYGSLKQ